jgi:antitoxin (DNA-binding transcriptional repressor) of toxin-antitoxin stability system
MTIVTIHQAKTNLSKLIAEVGGEVTIMRGSTPVVKLTPVAEPAAKPPRVPGRFKGLIEIDDRFFDPLPEEELRLWEGGDD